jgi:hypothetical protein
MQIPKQPACQALFIFAFKVLQNASDGLPRNRGACQQTYASGWCGIDRCGECPLPTEMPAKVCLPNLPGAAGDLKQSTAFRHSGRSMPDLVSLV